MDTMLNKFMIVSNLDNFAQYLSGEFYDKSEYTTELFVENLLRIIPPSRNMKIGTIIHSIFENIPLNNSISTIELSNQFTHNKWQINIDDKLDLKIALPSCKEISINKEIPHLNAAIRGRVDNIGGTTVHDLKVSSQFDVERYMYSWQWKTYLWMTEYDNFIYDVLVSTIHPDKDIITIKDYQQLSVYRYSNMNIEVENFIQEYVYCLNLLKPHIIRTAQKYNIVLKGT